jgi:fibronectin type 3 domain-containing protein
MKNYRISMQGLLVILLLAITITPLMVSPGYASWRENRQHVPARVTQLQGVQQGEGILLSWQKVDGCDSYRIYHEKGDSLQPGSYWVDVHAGQNSYLFTETAMNESYSFRVSALNGRQEGPLSTQVTVTMKGNSGPSDTAK